MRWIAAHTRDTAQRISGSTAVVAAGLILTATVVFAQTASQWIDFRYFDLSVRLLDSGHHRSVFGVISLVAEVVAAAAIGVRAVSRRNLGGIPAAMLVGVLTIPRALESDVRAFQRYDVPILVVPLAIVFVVVFALTFRDERRPRFIVWVSLGLLVCSFALHAIGPQADAASGSNLAHYTWAYQLTGMLKHSAELAGWMLLATGMIAGASRPSSGVPTYRRRHAVLLKLTRPTIRN